MVDDNDDEMQAHEEDWEEDEDEEDGGFICGDGGRSGRGSGSGGGGSGAFVPMLRTENEVQQCKDVTFLKQHIQFFSNGSQADGGPRARAAQLRTLAEYHSGNARCRRDRKRRWQHI